MPNNVGFRKSLVIVIIILFVGASVIQVNTGHVRALIYNDPPEFSSEVPFNGSINVPITISSLFVYISDEEGDRFDWSIETSPGIGSSSSRGDIDGTKTCNVSGLKYATTYIWYVNATDPVGSGQTSEKIYTFETGTGLNIPPKKPTIQGPKTGYPRIDYDYTFNATDPDRDNLYYYINWDDGNIEEWIGPFISGNEVIINYTYNITGTFTIEAKAKDIWGAESEWSELTVTMPRNRLLPNKFLMRLFERFPNVFPMIRHLLSLYNLT
jgi:hypothetical protein